MSQDLPSTSQWCHHHNQQQQQFNHRQTSLRHSLLLPLPCGVECVGRRAACVPGPRSHSAPGHQQNTRAGGRRGRHSSAWPAGQGQEGEAARRGRV